MRLGRLGLVACLVGYAASACLSDAALAVQCASDADCAAAEVCVDRYCADRAAFEAYEAARLEELREPCPAGQLRCGDTCVDVRTSLQHCGACDQACVPDGENLRAACQPSGEGARCVQACVDGFVDLDGAPGCEYACPETATRAERCDGVDNDCNGWVDAEDPRFEPPSCEAQQGVCAGAIARCEQGAIAACDPLDLGAWAASAFGAPYEAGGELACDGVDNDCDGEVDESCCEDEGVELLAGSEGMRVSDVRVEGAQVIVEALGAEGARRWALTPRGSVAPAAEESVALCPSLRVARGALRAAGALVVCGDGPYAASWVRADGEGAERLEPVLTSERRPTDALVAASADRSVATLRVPEAVASSEWVALTSASGDASALWSASASAPVVPALAGDTPLVIEPDPTTATVVAHALDASAEWTGESARWWSEADGLVPDARLELAFGTTAEGPGTALSAGADGRDVLWRSLGERWDAPLGPVVLLGRSAEVVRELRVIEAPSQSDAAHLLNGAAVVARTVRGLSLFGAGETRRVELDEELLADRAAQGQWDAALLDGVWIVVHPTGREADAPLALRRLGSNGGALCF